MFSLPYYREGKKEALKHIFWFLLYRFLSPILYEGSLPSFVVYEGTKVIIKHHIPTRRLWFIRLLIGRVIRKSHNFQTNNRMVLISYFVADKHRCATPSRSLDDDCSAGHLYRCNWRASSRRPHTRATCERRTDAKAFSDDAVVDVEVDRCIIPS